MWAFVRMNNNVYFLEKQRRYLVTMNRTQEVNPGTIEGLAVTAYNRHPPCFSSSHETLIASSVFSTFINDMLTKRVT